MGQVKVGMYAKGGLNDGIGRRDNDFDARIVMTEEYYATAGFIRKG